MAIQNDILKREDGLYEIHNPTIDVIVRGMMISTIGGRGTIVESVDEKNFLVYCRDSIGGTKEAVLPIDISKVICVWSIGTYEEAMNKIGQFNGNFGELMDKIKKLDGTNYGM